MGLERWRCAPALAGLLLTACGSPARPSPSEMPLAQLQSRYLQAAAAYNAAEATISAAENTYCVAPAGDLAKCQAALKQDRQSTTAFDEALRAVAFPDTYKAAVDKLIQDDGRLEQTLDRAATATSLSAAASIFVQLAGLYTATAQDADALRSLLKLPKGSALPATPSP